MKKKERLFELIKSLTKNEKSYFKKQARLSQGDKKYLLLFDAIDKQKEYDEAQLRDSLKGEQFLNQLAVAKNYLYHTIMRSLRSFHAGESFSQELQEGLDNVKVLYDKGLFKQAGWEIERLYKKAESHEQFQVMLELLQWKLRIERVKGYGDLTASELNEIREKGLHYIRALENTWKYQILSDEYFMIAPLTNEMADETRQKLGKLREGEMLRNDQLPLSYRAKYVYYNTNARLSHDFSDIDSAYQYGKQLVHLIQNLPESYFKSEQYNYLVALYNLVISLTYLEKHTELEETLRTLNTISPRNIKEAMVLFYARSLELNYYLVHEKYQKGIGLEYDIKQGLKKYGDKMNKEVGLSMKFSLCSLFIMVWEPKKALFWVNKLIDDEKPERRADVYCMARLLNMVVHFGLGNYDMLDSLTRSTRRILKKHDLYGEQEKTLLLYIGKKLPEATSKKEVISLSDELWDKLKSMQPASSPHYFNFKKWAEVLKEHV